MSIDVVLFDLGGVVCRFRPDARAQALAAHCDAAEAEVRANLFTSGFDDECDRGEHDEPAVLARVRTALGFRGGVVELRRAWATAFVPDPAVLDLVARARRVAATALLTDNGPVLLAALPAELPAVADAFDHLLFSCVLGATKPGPEAFGGALERAGVMTRRAFFVDDSPRNVAAAGALGITAHHFIGPAALQEALAAAGVL